MGHTVSFLSTYKSILELPIISTRMIIEIIRFLVNDFYTKTLHGIFSCVLMLLNINLYCKQHIDCPIRLQKVTTTMSTLLTYLTHPLRSSHPVSMALLDPDY